MLSYYLSFFLHLSFQYVEIQSEEYPQHTFETFERKPRILFVGDSMCVGMKDTFEKISNESGWEGISKCKVGSTSLQWREWLEPEIKHWQPDVVLISLGTNDGWIVDRIKKHSEVYSEIYKISSSLGARTVWVEPPKISTKFVKGIEAVRYYIHRDIPIRFETENYVTPPPGDGVHLTSNGYESWMIKLWSWMLKEDIIN